MSNANEDNLIWIDLEMTGLFPDTVKSNTAYPLDLIDNKRHDLGRTWYDGETWRPTRE